MGQILGQQDSLFGNAVDLAHCHFPGFSEEVSLWLVKDKAICGIGVDVISLDAETLFLA